MTKQKFTHKPNVPRRGANPAREQHGDKVKPQKSLAEKRK